MHFAVAAPPKILLLYKDFRNIFARFKGVKCDKFLKALLIGACVCTITTKPSGAVQFDLNGEPLTPPASALTDEVALKAWINSLTLTWPNGNPELK